MEKSNEKHLSYFKAENFKNFNKIELEDISLFNVIVGDNNVGKTNLLEALSFENNDITKYLCDLGFFVSNRHRKIIHFEEKDSFNNNYIFNYFNNSSDDKTFSLSYKNFDSDNLNSIKIQLKNKSELNKEEVGSIQGLDFIDISKINNLLAFNSNDKKAIVLVDFSKHLSYPPSDNYMPIIFSNQIHGTDLIEFYSDTVSKSKSQKLEVIENLNLFFNNIDNIEISQSFENYELFIGFKNHDKLMPLSMFGDGAIKFFRILMEVIMNKNGRLSIDEIDNGIHYKKLEGFLKKVVSTCVNNDTQIFCTTHSLECLKALKLIFESSENKKLQNSFRCYSLNKTKEGSIKAYKYDFEQFASTLDSDADIRGGE